MKCRINLERRAMFHNTDLYFIPVTCEIIASLAKEEGRGMGIKLTQTHLNKLVWEEKFVLFFPMCMCSCVAWTGVHCFSFQVLK